MFAVFVIFRANFVVSFAEGGDGNLSQDEGAEEGIHDSADIDQRGYS